MQLHNTSTKPADSTGVHPTRLSPRILVVDDEPDIRTLLQEILEDENYHVITAEDGNSARQALSEHPVDLVLLDIWMPDVDGITLLKELADRGQLPMPVIMMSGHGTVETAVEATRMGAHDYIEKPLSLAKLLLTVEEALQSRKTSPVTELPPYTSQLIPEPVGKSTAMQSLREHIQQIAGHDAPVLLSGEVGSGINIFANYLHSCQKLSGPFKELSLAALDEDQLGQELFGYEDKGNIYPGLLEQTANGTLLLSDIEALDASNQTRLNSALNNRAFNRINGKSPVELSSRLITSSHARLDELVDNKQFNADLFYRLNVLPIKLPALRDHREDVPELLSYYVTIFVDRDKLPYRKFSTAAQNRLRNYYWPGNIRELMNMVQRLLITGKTDEISLDEVETCLSQDDSRHSHTSLPIDYDRPLREARDLFEKTYFEHQLRKTNGSVGKVAKISGIERTHLYRKLRALGIDPKNVSVE
ncbi:MAG: sigma-54 dependent transcriptional regulator [Gammaproteobacteria bacterium]|nr:sigma-54 dependent transcriptional regulator [Gammaproteobacteria bacterium]